MSIFRVVSPVTGSSKLSAGFAVFVSQNFPDYNSNRHNDPKGIVTRKLRCFGGGEVGNGGSGNGNLRIG